MQFYLLNGTHNKKIKQFTIRFCCNWNIYQSITKSIIIITTVSSYYFHWLLNYISKYLIISVLFKLIRHLNQ